MGPEAKLELKGKKAVEKLGGMFLKFVSPGTSGMPDRIILMPGDFTYYAEFKNPAGGTFSPRQIWIANEFKKRGAKVYKIINIEALQKFLIKLTADQQNEI